MSLYKAELEFYKYNGHGNDFILVDDRLEFNQVHLTPSFIQEQCSRRFGVGADGVIVLSKSSTEDIKIQFYNADGSHADMCANGTRASAHLAYQLLNKKDGKLTIETVNDIYTANVDHDYIQLQMAKKEKLELPNMQFSEDFIKFAGFFNTGVPHLVLEVSGLNQLDVNSLGEKYRFHTAFGQAGTNVNFFEIDPDSQEKIYIRSYERGVEGETFSCGTGILATALYLNDRKAKDIFEFHTKGGEINIEKRENDFFYCGKVKQVFHGVLKI
jgi:diaminopimelate epimerase